MKKLFLFLLMTFVIQTFSFSQEKIPINTKTSTIKWMGELALFFGSHEGYINFKEGFFMKTDDKITGGEFIIDMNSITNTDIEEQEGKDSLINHLKDPDFFDVKKYPFAKLIITKIDYSNANNGRIEANLSIKDATKSIFFYVHFNYSKKEMTTKFKINRREFNVNYTSKIKDGVIADSIGFNVSVKI